MAQATVQEIQKASLDMLADFHDYCEKHGIVYFLSYGTALGAIRHHGFIPWDDDVDIDMHVDDIQKLITAWEQDGDKERYFLQTKQTDVYTPCPFIRLRKNHTTSMDEKRKNVPLHWGLPIDIFPVYNYPDDPSRAKKLEKLYRLAHKTSNFAFYHSEMPRFLHKLSIRACIAVLKRMKKISDAAGNSARLMYSSSKPVISLVPREVYFPHRLLQFEDKQLYGMNQTEKYLEHEFGDYMTLPPVEKRVTHGGLVDLENDYTVYTRATDHPV
ncbi:MAG: LicD family protein [Clostridia bacterium]|nr:LicD family protein [Clostridia bacterium]